MNAGYGAKKVSHVVRCHRCGTSKGNEDRGIYISWFFNIGEKTNKIIVWFHNMECKTKWEVDHHVVYETMEYSNVVGIVKIKDEKIFDAKNDDI